MNKRLLTLALVALPLAAQAGHATPLQASPTVPSVQASAKAPLGDLGAFRTIAADTLTLVKANKLPAATARVKDLETAWDTSQAKLQPMNRTVWRKVDIAIDRVLNELRADKVQAASSAEALNALIGLMDSLK